MGFPGGSTGKEPDCQYRRCKRHRINLWVRKKPWRRKWQHALVFLPGKFREHESLGTTVHRVSKSQTQLLVHPHTQIFNIAKLERSYILDIFQLYFAFFFFFFVLTLGRTLSQMLMPNCMLLILNLSALSFQLCFSYRGMERTIQILL